MIDAVLLRLGHHTFIVTKTNENHCIALPLAALCDSPLLAYACNAENNMRI
jgi:hypothetical protein